MIVAALAIATTCPPALEPMERTVVSFDGVTVVESQAETPTRRVAAVYSYEFVDGVLECDGTLEAENRRTTPARIRYRHAVPAPDGWKPRQGLDEATGVCGTQGLVVFLADDRYDPGEVRSRSIAWAVPLLRRADIDEDGKIDSADQGLLFADWGTAAWRSDLNGDGTVNGADLGMLQEAWTR